MTDSKIKEILKKGRIILLIILLLFALISIHPNPWNEGVAVRSVAKNSAAYEAGISSPLGTDKPMFREIIKKINGKTIKDADEYKEIIKTFQADDLVSIETATNFEKQGEKRKFSFFKIKKEYTLTVKPLLKITQLNETEEKLVNKTIEVNETAEDGSITTVEKIIEEKIIVPKTTEDVIGVEDIGLTVYDAPTTNLKKGLDLEGGTRVLLEPETVISEEDMDIVISNLRQRLNVYGLSDIIIREAGEFLSDKKYIIVEVAGATEDDVKDLIGKQGKFEAKIKNVTVFKGGQDIKSVCRTPDCSFPVDPRRPCGQIAPQQYQCSFSFGITLSIESAQKQADETKNLEIVTGSAGESYLSENIDFYLDDELVDSLKIGSELKGKADTQIALSGPGSGITRQEAIQDSAKNMKRLQTILITGSLPVKLNIAKVDTISPILGKEFVKNALLIGALAILAVVCVVAVKYRKVAVIIPMAITMISELILILGFATLVNWQLDLASIAAIIVAIGTGVDNQIVITDETLKSSKGTEYLNWKEKFKRAFYIIMGSYLTVVVALLPLLTAGAGLLKGFALTTIAGVTFGVFITRPAFASMLEVLFKE